MDSTDFTAVPLLDGMTTAELDDVASHFNEVHVRSGDELTHEHEHAATFFIVLDGQVRVKVHEEAVAELGPGDHFGEVALVTGDRRNATVKAIDTCRVAKMMAWDFSELILKNPALASRISAAAASRQND
ncbi:MAG: cyclic nucleotide-binding domain-containing protein [Acidimicrobiales bacterium]